MLYYYVTYVEEGEEVYVTHTVYNKETGLPTRRTVTLNGKEQAPPDGEPSHTAFDYQGRPTHMQWVTDKVRHRTDGPSSIVLFPETGIHMTESFEIHGQPRDPSEGPYRIRRNKDGKVWQEEYAETAPVTKPVRLEP